MGVENADSRGSAYAPASRLGWLNAIEDHVGAVVLDRRGGPEPCDCREGVGSLGTVGLASVGV